MNLNFIYNNRHFSAQPTHFECACTEHPELSFEKEKMFVKKVISRSNYL